MTTSRPATEAERKAAVDALAKGCGSCLGVVLRYVTLFLVVAFAIKHNPF